MGSLNPTLLVSHCLASSSSTWSCSMAFWALARALSPAIVLKPDTTSAFSSGSSFTRPRPQCCTSANFGPCPPPHYNKAARVEHLVVLEGGPVLDYICKASNLPPLYVADLIHFGAVYYASVCPEPPATATPEQIQLFKEVTAPLVLKKRSSIKGKTVREAQKTFRITHAHEFVEAGTYLRVHVHPKRFPRCYQIDWKSRIIAVTESYVFLDKPAGTSEKQVKKLYLALAAAPVPVGIISHYMRPVNMAPSVLVDQVGEQLSQNIVSKIVDGHQKMLPMINWQNPPGYDMSEEDRGKSIKE